MSVGSTPFIAQDELESRAKEVLEKFGSYKIPVDPLHLAQQLDIDVNNATFGDGAISGVLRKSDGRHQILVNEDDSPFRKRFSIAHELAHFLLHLDEDCEFIDPEVNLYRSARAGEKREDTPPQRRREIQANLFAAALLMPAELVRDEFRRITDIGRLAQLFKVSKDAMGSRINSLGLGD